MKHQLKNHGPTFLIAAVVAAVTAGGPVLARSVADFARNADKVDGRHAVGATPSSQKRGGKLVATNRGRLPNNIIRKAPAARDADRLGGFGPSAFVRPCLPGAIRGQALIPGSVGLNFEPVSGFSTIYGGPLGPDGTNCHFGEARARRVGPGIYDARLAPVAWTCTEPMPANIITAIVSVQSAQPLVATYQPHCENNGVYVRVRITDLNGVAQDAPSSVVLLDANGIPIP